jgi:hypothetical protein
VFYNGPKTYRSVAGAMTVEESKILQETWVLVAGNTMTVAELADSWQGLEPDEAGVASRHEVTQVARELLSVPAPQV